MAVQPSEIIDEIVACDTVPRGSMLDNLAQFKRWLDRDQCVIRNVHTRLVPLKLNKAQEIMLSKMMIQAAGNLPIRLVVLKARKVGVSTFVQALFFFLCSHVRNQVAGTLAHATDATSEIFQIARLAAKHDALSDPHITRRILHFAHGSRYWAQTAGGEGVGAGGTPNLLHLSEVALWKKNKEETEYSATQAVPKNPDTIIVYESTARGRELFYDRFEDAHQTDHPYEPVFVPWYFDESCSEAVHGQLALNDDERAVIARARKQGIELSHESLQWRRSKIMEVGPAVFKQEYPSTPEEAIQGMTDLILPGMRDCVTDEVPFEYEKLQHHCLVGGIDYGYADATSIITAVYWDQTLYVLWLYRAVEKLAADHVEGIADNHTYYVDPSAHAGMREMRAAMSEQMVTASLVPAPRPWSSRHASIADAEWQMVQAIMAQGRLKILPDAADQIILEADNLSWNQHTGKPDMTRGESWGHFDTLDALRYMVSGCTLSSGPTPTIERRVGRREALRRL